MNLCFYCGVKMTKYRVPVTPTMKTRDHKVPVSRLGRRRNTAGNLVYCCYTCNQDKGDNSLEEYRVILAHRRGQHVVFAGEMEKGTQTL